MAIPMQQKAPRRPRHVRFLRCSAPLRSLAAVFLPKWIRQGVTHDAKRRTQPVKRFRSMSAASPSCVSHWSMRGPTQGRNVSRVACLVELARATPVNAEPPLSAAAPP